MTLAGGNWTYTHTPTADTTALDLAFTNAADASATIWDNNGGQDWHVAVSPCDGPPPTPTGLTATATSPTTISLDWDDAPAATSYTVYRGGIELATVTASDATATDLIPETTYSFTVRAINDFGPSSLTAPAEATTPPAVAPPPAVPFAMDGAADSPGYLLADTGFTLYAALRGDVLYVATWAPGMFGSDHFILLSNTSLPAASAAAPWAKSGLVAVAPTSPYIGAESSNTFAGWFNTNGATTTIARGADGQQLEGTFDVAQAFGGRPAELYLTALAYQTRDGGELGAQSPGLTINNGDIDPAELLCIPLEALRDENANGTFDRLEPGLGFRITAAAKETTAFTLTWNCFPGRTYKIQSSTTLAADSWDDVPDSRTTAGATDLTLTRTLSLADPAAFFQVVLLP
jgi:hypothetical protein